MLLFLYLPELLAGVITNNLHSRDNKWGFKGMMEEILQLMVEGQQKNIWEIIGKPKKDSIQTIETLQKIHKPFNLHEKVKAVAGTLSK